MSRLALWAGDAQEGAVAVTYRIETTGTRAREILRSRLRRRRNRTFRLDRVGEEANIARELASALQMNENGVTHVRGWESAFAGSTGPERLYRFNLLRETIFAPRTAQIWWMSEEFRDTLMRHAPDTWSFMRLKLMIAESDEYVELPPTLARIVRSNLGLNSFSPIPRQSFLAMKSLNAAFSNLNSSDLKFLSHLEKLDTLLLVGTKVSDLSPLAGVRSLRYLALIASKVSDLTPLASLTALKLLALDLTKVTDLTPLSGNKSLETVLLDRSQVRDISPLLTLPNLRYVLLPNGTEWKPHEGPPPEEFFPSGSPHIVK